MSIMIIILISNIIPKPHQKPHPKPHPKPHALYSLRGASHLRRALRASSVVRAAVSIRVLRGATRLRHAAV